MRKAINKVLAGILAGTLLIYPTMSAFAAEGIEITEGDDGIGFSADELEAAQGGGDAGVEVVNEGDGGANQGAEVANDSPAETASESGGGASESPGKEEAKPAEGSSGSNENTGDSNSGGDKTGGSAADGAGDSSASGGAENPGNGGSEAAGSGAENQNPGSGGAEAGGPQAENAEPKEEERHRISTDRSYVSLGTVYQSEEPRPQSFQITNEGNTTIQLKWTQADPNTVFGLSFYRDINSPLAPGESLGCTVGTRNNAVEPGDYTSVIVFEEVGNSSSSVSIQVSMRVEKKQEAPKAQDGIVEVNQQSSPAGGVVQSDTQGVVNGQNVVTVSNRRLTVKADPSFAGYVYGEGTFSDGSTATLTASEKSGYRFVEWRGPDGRRVSGSRTFTTERITSDVTYTAKFEYHEFRVRVESDNENAGTVKGGGLVDYNDDVSIEAVPKDGYSFVGWYEKDKLVSRKKNYLVEDVDENHKFIAVFQADSHTVNVSCSPAEGGSARGAGKYKDGDSVTIDVTPAKGYVFKGLQLNNQEVTKSASYTIGKIDRDLSFTAYFEKEGDKIYTITSGVANGGGLISPSGVVSVAEGGSITYTMAPQNGYAVLMVDVDGQHVGPRDSWTFLNVKENHTISVAYAPKENSVQDVKMDRIISTEEAAAIASGKLERGSAWSESRSSEVVTPEDYARMKQEEMNAAMAADTGNNAGTSSGASSGAAGAAGSGSQGAGTQGAGSGGQGGKSGASSSSDPEDAEEAQVKSGADSDDSQAVHGSGSGSDEVVVETVEEIVRPMEQNLVGMDNTENLGEVVSGYNFDLATGVYQTLDISPEAAEKLIDAGDDTTLIRSAYDEGYLDIVVNNSYLSKDGGEDGLSIGNGTIKNVMEAIGGMLTKEEKLKLFAGESVVVNFNVSAADSMGDADKNALKSAKDVEIDDYFFMTLMKTVGSVTTVVTELPKEIEITLEVPAEYRSDEKTFCLVRAHGSEVDILQDLDDDPDTVTVRTDRFSPYAFAYQAPGAGGAAADVAEEAGNKRNPLVFVGIIFAGIVLTIGILLIGLKKRGKR